MPKKAYLANHFNSHELKQKYLKSQDTIESRRWHLLWKICLGWTIKNSALAVGIDYQYAKKIVKKYNELGAEGVKNQRQTARNHRRGKSPLLNDQQLQKLITALRERPADGGIWTGPLVARWIEKETQLKQVGNQRGWDYLKKCNYDGQSPRPKHRQGDEQLQQQFKKNLPLKIKELQEQYPDAEIMSGFLMNIESGSSRYSEKFGLQWGKDLLLSCNIGMNGYMFMYLLNPKRGKLIGI